MREAKPKPAVGRDWRRADDAAWRVAVGGRTGGGVESRYVERITDWRVERRGMSSEGDVDMEASEGAAMVELIAVLRLNQELLGTR